MTKTLAESVPEQVRATLAIKRIRAAELARRLSVSQAWLSRRLSGETAISTEDLDRIAQALNVPVETFLPMPGPGWAR